MLTDHEKRFVSYWETHREKEGKLSRQLLFGIPFGLIFSIPIILILFSGRLWFKRADFVAVSHLNPVLLITCIMLITVFIAVFYKRHQWDMREQQYLELKQKEKNSK